MIAVNARVTVYRKDLNRAFLTQGGRWQDRVTRRMFREAVSEAPRRSGGLRAAHRIHKVTGSQWYVTRDIVNRAEHAEWVHEGTSGKVGAPTLFLPAGGPGSKTRSPHAGKVFSARRVKEVRGQGGNNWLERACTRIAVRYGAVRVS